MTKHLLKLKFLLIVIYGIFFIIACSTPLKPVSQYELEKIAIRKTCYAYYIGSDKSYDYFEIHIGFDEYNGFSPIGKIELERRFSIDEKKKLYLEFIAGKIRQRVPDRDRMGSVTIKNNQ